MPITITAHSIRHSVIIDFSFAFLGFSEPLFSRVFASLRASLFSAKISEICGSAIHPQKQKSQAKLNLPATLD